MKAVGRSKPRSWSRLGDLLGGILLCKFRDVFLTGFSKGSEHFCREVFRGEGFGLGVLDGFGFKGLCSLEVLASRGLGGHRFQSFRGKSEFPD